MLTAAQVVIERDESEFARLSQLGDILGLTPFDVSGASLTTGGVKC